MRISGYPSSWTRFKPILHDNLNTIFGNTSVCIKDIKKVAVDTNEMNILMLCTYSSECKNCIFCRNTMNDVSYLQIIINHYTYENTNL